MNRICSNCSVYNWPTEDIPVFRCSNCKFLSYCSSECQKEHWKKVHKKQCKTLAGQIEVPASAHLPGSCPGCKEEEELGTKTINSQDCPAWGCLMRSSGSISKSIPTIDDTFPSAVKSGEMTREFSTRTEHTLFIMLQIINKLIRANPILSKPRNVGCLAELTELTGLIVNERKNILIESHLFPTEYMNNCNSPKTQMSKEFLYRLQIMKAVDNSITSITSVKRTLGTAARDPFLTLETLKLLASFLSNTVLHHYQKGFERLNVRDDLPTEVQEMIDELGTSTEFEGTWDRVLGALEAGLVHHSDLLDVLCGGNRNKRCDQCQKPIIIERLFDHSVTLFENATYEKPFVTFRKRLYSCSAEDCQTTIKYEDMHFVVDLITLFGSKVLAMGRDNTCDFCFKLCANVHRCSQCMAKVYCSQKCQLEDWGEVHEKICNKGEVGRKVKGGKKERVDNVGKEVAIEKLTECENYVEINASVRQVCKDFVKKKY